MWTSTLIKLVMLQPASNMHTCCSFCHTFKIKVVGQTRMQGLGHAKHPSIHAHTGEDVP